MLKISNIVFSVGIGKSFFLLIFFHINKNVYWAVLICFKQKKIWTDFYLCILNQTYDLSVIERDYTLQKEDNIRSLWKVYIDNFSSQCKNPQEMKSFIVILIVLITLVVKMSNGKSWLSIVLIGNLIISFLFLHTKGYMCYECNSLNDTNCFDLSPQSNVFVGVRCESNERAHKTCFSAHISGKFYPFIINS